MIYNLEIKESAQNDVIAAVEYYENQQEYLGVRFLDCWEAYLAELQQEPLIYQKKYKKFRQVLIKPFPYHIIYEVEEKTIVVYKVVYGGRHPHKRYTKK
jgi:plasmid stabilization system protein ParE